MSEVKTIEMDPATTATQWTESARETWQRMGERVGALVRHYGETSDVAREAAMSYVQVATSIVGWGDVRVSKDGDLSLFCVSSSITFGIIWHEDKRKCTNEGCKAYIHNDGKAYWYGSYPDRKDCGDHTPNVPLDAPMPGTWSFHS